MLRVRTSGERPRDRLRPRRPEAAVIRPPRLSARPTIADYDHALSYFCEHPEPDSLAFGHLRDLVLVGVRVGTFDADDVYRHVRPAMLALTILLDPGSGAVGPALAERIRGVVGDRPGRWAEAVATVDRWPGSLHSLLRKPDREPGGPAPYAVLGLDGHLWRGANILLALAPPETVGFLASEAAELSGAGPTVGDPRAIGYGRLLLRIASHAPLSRAFADHVLTPEAGSRLRAELAGNPLTPDPTLIRLLTFAPDEPDVAAAICFHECTPPVVRLAAYRAVRVPEIRLRALQTLERDMDVVRRVELIAAATADDAQEAHALLRDVNADMPMAARLFAYAHLARISAPEIVWTMELDRTGSLAEMHPAVRASMESGSQVPLLEAAVADPYRGLHHATVDAAGMLRAEELLDRPFPWMGTQPGCEDANSA